jgi:hypothetical protein
VERLILPDGAGGVIRLRAASFYRPAPLRDAWMDALRDDLWTRRKPGALADAEVVTLYRLTLSLGLVARHRNALDGPV